MLCCEENIENFTRNKLMEKFMIIKEYDPQPKNEDGSIRWFLYRWDDGKSGVRKLLKCKHCGCFYLVQAYHLHKFSEKANVQFEDWYPITDEKEADCVNQMYTGLQWEVKHRPVMRCEDDICIFTKS